MHWAIHINIGHLTSCHPIWGRRFSRKVVSPNMPTHETRTTVMGSAFMSSLSLYIFLLTNWDLEIKLQIPFIFSEHIAVFQCFYIYMWTIKIQFCSVTWPCRNSNVLFIYLIPMPILSNFNLFPLTFMENKKIRCFQFYILESPAKQDMQNIFIYAFSAERVHLKNH